MKKLLVFSLVFVLIISALLLLAGCKKECTHSYEKTVTPPTCTEAGEEKFSCTKCDYYYTTKIEATGHTGGTPVEENRTEATCTVDGKYDSVVYCTACDVELSRNEVTITAPGHSHGTPVKENRTEATCTVDGKYDSVVYCTVCEAELSRETTVLAAPGHINGMPVGENSTICMDGKYDSVIYCTVCDAEVSRETVTVTEKIHDVQNGVCTICGGNESTPDLKYSQNDDGTYTVTGKGTCTETDIVIGIYNNRDVTAIGDEAFSCCTSLTSIELPDSLTTIGDYAFYECTSLTSIKLPDSLTTIGNYAFYNCTSLTSITVVEGNENFKSIDGNLYSKDGKTLIQYAIGKTDTAFIVPEGVTTIGEYAFSYCDSLTSIELPDSLTTIGDNAFFGCDSLTSIELPDSLTTIAWSAFSDCDSLTSIVIPKGVTTIGGYAFYYCTSLTSIVIPEGVTAIGNYAFSGCTSLTIYCEVAKKPSGWSDSWNSSNRPVVWGRLVTGDGFVYETTNNSVSILGYIGLDNNIVIPTVIDGKNVTTIGDSAFRECTSLTSIVIPEGVTTIGDNAFFGCDSLTSIELPDSLTTIGDGAFGDCTSLTSIVIPEGVTTIGNYAFTYCTSLTSIELPDSLTAIGEGAFYYCTSLTSIVIPEGVTTIGSYAFANCTSLTIYCEVTKKPDGWSSIWNYSGCPVVWGYTG